ncbi:M23 family metallopeptidase [Paenibacillus sp. TAB 01]|uniref:M23 family metallopeptidase n=1 Tax=Paenibacillus sp. TAB 01 TaxID=3368988 RepID=UPI0037523367
MIQSRKRSTGRKANKTGVRSKWVLSGIVAAAFCVGTGYGLWKGWPASLHPAPQSVAEMQPPPAPKFRKALEFAMTDFERGWIRYEDGLMTTADGGATWSPAESPPALEQPVTEEPDFRMLQEAKVISEIQIQSRAYPVKQFQFITDRLGWALVQDDGEAGSQLWMTTDGGVTWLAEAAETVKEAVRQEKQLIQQRRAEAARYASAEQAMEAFRSEWHLMPKTVSQGDAVLVRRSQPGSVEWQGKTYQLQPAGTGYYTYLPVATGVKPGDYPIGDQVLKVTAQNFPKQYLQVTEELDSMRQDTKRIDADQAKIDKARSRSQPEFLYNAAFLQPIEGTLTTPYGHMRYVNGKLSGSHLALDLAAKQGTPIKAANDGVVALADSLYLTGNSIYIDHGMGLFSQYAHLSELRVKTGDAVKRGDIIGLVGTTGFSTGPHLHFTFWVHNVPANPHRFFNTTPFQWTDK